MSTSWSQYNLGGAQGVPNVGDFEQTLAVLGTSRT